MAALAVVGTTTAAPSAAAQTGELQVLVLSNRADLVSGDDALVEVVLPPQVAAADLSVEVGGRDVTSAFAERDDGRFYGRVEGLELGENLVTARTSTGLTAQVTITNHPIGGPVFAGPQVQPWICTTQERGLGPARDEQCNVEPVHEYQYRPVTGTGFRPYDPDSPPAQHLVATTTTDHGETVPYIVRVERGVIDRGFYAIAVLFEPGQPWEPWARQRGWNGKVLWPFGSGGEPAHVQIAEPGVMDDQALSRGFAVATTAMAHNSQGFNDVVQAEGVMMVKEHLVERYGEIRYTIGTGCSGGSMSQYSIAANYPGLLDGIMPACSFPDVLTTYTWFADCKQLHHYFTQTSPHLWNEAQRQQAMGHAAGSTCAIGSVRAESYHSPTGGSNCAEFDWSYDPVSNPAGVRCSVPDYAVSVFGERPEQDWTDIERRNGRGFAQAPYDTTGVEWGLQALLEGEILPEQFVDLNEKVGGLDIDSNLQPGRSLADLGAVEIAYRSGRFTHGREMAKVPHLELRGSSNFEWHHDFQSIQVRNRLLRDNGHADQMVYWKSPGPLVPDPTMSAQAFLLMDRWLAAVEADSSDVPLETKVLRHKPDDAVDACWLGGRKVTDQDVCRTALPHFSDPRTAAGQPPTADLAKCHLEPLAREHYAGMSGEFTESQWARLQSAFPDGVCDYSRPAMFQQPPDGPWMTFAGGPGGVPLGPAPASTVTAAGAAAGPATDAPVAAAPAARSLPATGGLPLAALGLVLATCAAAVRRSRRRTAP